MEKELLINLGLTDGEAKVYLSLLKLGSSTVGPIVKKADVAYSNIYDILDRLLEKGLISFIIKEKTKFFQSVPPSRLNEYLEKKEQELEKEKQTLKELLPELEKIQSPDYKQEAEIFLGIKGLKTAYERLLEEHKEKKGEWLFFFTEEANSLSDEFYSRNYSRFKNIPGKGIAAKNYKKSNFIKQAHFKMKYVDFPIPGNIDIYGDNILLVSWAPNPTTILITSKDMAEKFRNYFYSIWKRKD